MPPLSATVFRDELRRLDTESFARFVADLWEARGWETEVDLPVIRATRQHGNPRSQTIVMSHEGESPETVTPDIVVTNRRTAQSETPAGIPLVDAADLYQRAIYGIEREEYAALCQRYFDRSGFVDPSETSRTLATLFDAVKARSGTSSAVLVAIALLLASGVAAVSMTAPESRPSATAAVPSTEATAPSAGTTTPSPKTPTPARDYTAVPWEDRYAEAGCPPPPQIAPPSHLQPTVAAEGSDPDTWTFLGPANISAVLGPGTLPILADSDGRQIVKYRDASGHLYYVTIDHWDTYSRARTVADTVAEEKDLVAIWGRYTFMVTGYTPNRTRLPHSVARPNATELIASVSAPNGSRLGHDCVAAIAVSGDRDDGSQTETA